MFHRKYLFGDNGHEIINVSHFLHNFRIEFVPKLK